MDKPGGFLGRDALLAARERGVTRRVDGVVNADPPHDPKNIRIRTDT